MYSRRVLYVQYEDAICTVQCYINIVHEVQHYIGILHTVHAVLGGYSTYCTCGVRWLMYVLYCVHKYCTTTSTSEATEAHLAQQEKHDSSRCRQFSTSLPLSGHC